MQSTIIKISQTALAGIAAIALAGCAHKPVTNSSDMSTTTSSNFVEKRPATGRVVFIFDPRHTNWALYDRQGDLVRTGRASGGKNYCPDIGEPCRTVVGTFTAFREDGPECKSTKFPVGEGGAPMPNCMYFHKGYAIHGSDSVPNYNASHGCIRVTPSDAAWLDDRINPGATVIVRPY